MAVFGDYALYYNLLYKDKDYGSESDFILDIFRRCGCSPLSLLDLGCGTGRHALEMTRRGVQVTGVDMSQAMLTMGRELLRSAEGISEAELPILHQGDVRTVRLNQTFDAVTSLFHVMSYQNLEADCLAEFATAKTHLRPGGVFLFDFWYGPGVLTDPPTERHRILDDDSTLIERHAVPLHRVNDNIVEVTYHITLIDKNNGDQRQLHETHSMRYWFLPELRHLAQCSDFAVVAEGAWMQDTMPHEDTWNAWMAVQRR